MVRYSRLWVVIADGEHARLVARDPHARSLHTFKELTSRTAGQRSHDLGSDRPGRTHESVGTTRHAVAPKHDPHQLAKQDFVASVAREVNEAAASGGFDHLVLVAPAHALADLRGGLDQAVLNAVVGTLAKDLTKTPDHELAGHLDEFL